MMELMLLRESPKLKTSISLQYLKTINMPTIKNGTPIARYDQPFIEKDPICHIVIVFMSSLYNAEIVVSIAFVKRENTIPARIIVLFERLLSTLFAKAITTNTVMTPDKKPITGSARFPITGIEIPNIMYAPTPKDAPDETPNVKGDASGFFKID